VKADKETVTRLLKTARGQLDGILRMIDEDRYCIDIFNQLLATESILKKANKEIISAHLEHCVKDAFSSEQDSSEKVQEIISVFNKLTK